MDKIRQILAAKDFAKFIGVAEGIHLEVKRESYDLSTAAGRYELAKDVTAFANSDGGYLLIGLQTAPATSAQVDVIDALTLIPKSDFNTGQYTGVLDEHVFPDIDGLAIEWLESGDTGIGVGVVYIPAQKADRKPFLIAKVVEDGSYLKQIVVGYSERSEASNDPLAAEKLQRAIQKGRDSHSNRLTRIEDKLNTLLERGPVNEPMAKTDAEAQFDLATLEARIKSAFEGTEK